MAALLQPLLQARYLFITFAGAGRYFAAGPAPKWLICVQNTLDGDCVTHSPKAPN